MATYFWVGSSGTWTDATNHWATSSGGAPNAANVPTSADDVIFDANSNTGTGAFTITLNGTSGAPNACNNFRANEASALDGALGFSGVGIYLDVYGDFLLPTTRVNFVNISGGSTLTWKATSKTVTITTNGTTLTYWNTGINGVGGVFNLGSAYVGNNFNLTAGTLNTNNFAMNTPGAFSSTGSLARTLNFGSSTITNNGISGTVGYTFSGTNLTINAGTSTLIDQDPTAYFNVSGGPYTFYNVSWTSAALVSVNITGTNTFNNLTFPARTTTGTAIVTVGADQTVNGTFTAGATTSAITRIMFCSDVVGTPRTITAAAVGTFSDVDFRDIVAAGASGTWSGTRLGNCLGNTNITFDAAKTVYTVGSGASLWYSTQWALTAGGATSVNNFPLAQDTAVVDNNGALSSLSPNTTWNYGTIDFSSRTTALTWSTSTFDLYIYGSLIFSSAITVNSATGTYYFYGRNATQSITSAAKTISADVTVNAINGTVATTDAFNNSGTFTFAAGTLLLKNGVTATMAAFTTSGTTFKYLRSGLTGTRATISQASGTVTATYMWIQDSAATGGATFTATSTTNSNGLNNTGWTFASLVVFSGVTVGSGVTLVTS